MSEINPTNNIKNDKMINKSQVFPILRDFLEVSTNYLRKQFIYILLLKIFLKKWS